jgi:hypothetical protein
MAEQRNRYKGEPPRPCVRVVIRAPDGAERELELVADTGSPFALIVAEPELERFQFWSADHRQSNFGSLTGGLLQVEIAELDFEDWMIGYGSDEVVEVVQQSSREFAGLAGLPLLRLFEYGGHWNEFWLRNNTGEP